MASLYEINEQILECVDMETGEIVDEQMLDMLELARSEKIENIALWIKNLAADAKAYGDEKKNFAAKETAAKNKAESLKSYLQSALAGEKFKTQRVTISYRKSVSVECKDVNSVDDDYLRFADPELNKAKIKDAIKQGIEVKDCSLVEGQNMQIK